jgi:hypothetical protein
MPPKNYKSTMKKLMKTRVHRYAPRLPGIAENEGNWNNYVNYTNDFEAEAPNNNYENDFHYETEAEEYAALKAIMAEPLAPSAEPIPNGRATPAPQRPIAVASAGAGPSGPKASIGSAFSAFTRGSAFSAPKRIGGMSKKLIRRNRKRRSTHRR